MVAGVKRITADWKYDVVSIGYPGRVVDNHPVTEPRNLAIGWVGFWGRLLYTVSVPPSSPAAYVGVAEMIPSAARATIAARAVWKCFIVSPPSVSARWWGAHLMSS